MEGRGRGREWRDGRGGETALLRGAAHVVQGDEEVARSLQLDAPLNSRASLRPRVFLKRTAVDGVVVVGGRGVVGMWWDGKRDMGWCEGEVSWGGEGRRAGVRGRGRE